MKSVMKKKIAAKKKVVKRKASHSAATGAHKAVKDQHEGRTTGKSEREEQDHREMERLKAEKADLQAHPDKQRELGEQQKQKYDEIEKEIAEVLTRHGIPMQSEFMVQIRSWFLEARNQNVPPEMREGPGVATSAVAA